MQPVDRLGQPLAVGDWVVFESERKNNPVNGRKFTITGFNEVFGEPIAYHDNGSNSYLWCLTKINPKPETTKWDNCEWQPNLQEIDR
jgi:hypothetical protein